MIYNQYILLILQKMSMFAASRYYQQKPITKQAKFGNSHMNGQCSIDPFKQIQDLLNECQSFFSKNVQEFINEWKTVKIKQYKQIIAPIDTSLRENITSIICQQIHIERQQLSQLLNKIQKDLMKLQQQHKKDKQNNQNNDKTVSIQRQRVKASASLKSRSISNDPRSRRKLSKGSFFADAKKLNTIQSKANQDFIITSPLAYCNKFQKNPSKIKKAKRKQQNCFETLQRFNNNSTSASNFMLNYIDAKEVMKNNDLNKNEYLKVGNYAINEKAQNQSHLTAKHQIVPSNVAQNACSNESQTYQKLMINFEEKISRKLDDFMSKYSKVQQKIENQDQVKSQKPNYALNVPQKLDRHLQNTVSIEQSINKSSDELLKLSQAPMMSRNKQSNPNALNQTNLDSSNSYEQTKIKQDSYKKAIKSIQINSKIVKNKVKFTENFSQSLQEIQLSRQNNTKKIYEEAQRIKRMQQQKNLQQQQAKIKSLEEDRIYFQRLILDFNFCAQKVVKMPITGELFYVIVKKYENFCRVNHLQVNPQIISIKTKKLQNVNKEFNELLTKMQKMVDTKCQASKKEKILTYLQKFIKAAITYDEKINLMMRIVNQTYTQGNLKTKIRQLKLQISQT